MNKKFTKFTFFSILAILIFSSNLFYGQSSIQQIDGYSSETTMDLDIIFLGISNSFVDTNSLDDILNSLIQGTSISTQDISLDLSDVGSLALIHWNFNYIFPSESYYQAFRDTAIGNSVYETVEDKEGYFINATILETWLALSTNYPDSYTPPSNGYTLLLSDLSDLGPHWYRTYYEDIDTGSNFTRNFQNSFGGYTDSRMYYIDLSVEHSYLELYGSDGPIQNLTAKYDPATESGQNRISQYFRDWIYEAISDLFSQNTVYSTPNFRQSYSTDKLSDINEVEPNSKQNLDIYLINNISNKNVNELMPFVNETRIKNSFEDVLPWYDWNVNIKPIEAQDYPKLSEIISKATDTSANITLDERKQGGVDLYTIYDWIFNEIFYERASSSIPFVSTKPNNYLTFAFAFDVGVLGIGYKTEFVPSILGASLFGVVTDINFLTVSGRFIPLTLLALDYEHLFIGDDFNRTSGYTQLIIHENGHAIGASHPHGNSWAMGMVNDPMSYIAYSYEFSRFTKDTIRRGEINLALHYSKSYLDAINDDEKFLENTTQYYNLKLAKVNQYYNIMEYSKAYESAWDLFSFIKQSYNDYKQLQISKTKSQGAEGFSLEIVFGVIIIYSLIKMKSRYRN